VSATGRSKQNIFRFGREAYTKITSLHELFIKELQDIFDAELQLIKALPKMAKAASSDELREGFEEHVEKTREHAQRLEQIFENLGEDAKGEKCKGMEGLIKEGSELLKEDLEGPVKDAALISAAQRVEHYEIAACGTVRTWANQLQHEEAVSLLEQTLSEEKFPVGFLEAASPRNSRDNSRRKRAA
jgi:ferritin-like metal-binding protein YciE